ncbi:MAG: trehalose-phosphatase [Nitrospira sp.]|nr:trehalose-phosphatase [Nitrospira sp.]MDH4302713.1 trehalose-phosphatase [Nitrospira sp.]MDH5192759.1 trehalose-phosphatase [Nitrospira sp.]
MEYLLTDKGKLELEQLIKGRSLYAFDFDGTLAKIVREHHAAKLSRPIRFWLEKLAGGAPTAIISGRSVEDLQSRVGTIVPHLIGNHGSEGPHTSQEDRQLVRETCQAWLQSITERFHDELAQCGVSIEHKSYSLSFHYRTVDRRDAARLLISRVIGELSPPPRIVLGKSVVNVMPPTASHKGTALLEYMRRLDCPMALYVGDDETDEDVFALRDHRILTVRIGKKNGSSARYFLKRQVEITAVLRFLVEGGDQGLHTWSECHEQGSSRPAPRPNE